MAISNCDILSVEEMSANIYRVRMVPDRQIDFRAGQYLMVSMDERDRRPFSIASPPMEKRYIELHIGTSDLNPYAFEVVTRARRQRVLKVDMPHGAAWLRETSPRPRMLVAGGTGFSYARSLLLTSLQKQPRHPVILYWGVREPKYLYALQALEKLAIEHAAFTFIPLVEQETVAFQGRTGLVVNVVLQDHRDLSRFDIYIAGRFEMAKVARELFCAEAGASASHIYGDAFAFIE